MREYVRALDALDKDLHKYVQRMNREERVEEAIATPAEQHYDEEHFRRLSILPFPGPIPSFLSEPMTSNRTGLGSLIATLRQDMANAKQSAIDAGEEIKAAVTEVRTVAADVKSVASEMSKEAADARAALGQLTNGGPPLE
jgi:hypothetical protein